MSGKASNPIQAIIDGILPNILTEVLRFLANKYLVGTVFEDPLKSIGLIDPHFADQLEEMLQTTLHTLFVQKPIYADANLGDHFIKPALTHTIIVPLLEGKIPDIAEAKAELNKILRSDIEAKQVTLQKGIQVETLADDFYACFQQALAKRQTPGELLLRVDIKALSEKIGHSNELLEEVRNKVTLLPSALSKSPRTLREATPVALIGRDTDWKWLSENRGDRLLVGQSGSGKTALLYKLARQDDAWFVVSTHRHEIAAALKSQQPATVIVDDAQAYSQAIIDLRQLRQELSLKFSIIASCWSGEQERIQQLMSLVTNQIHHLPLLTRDEIVEVVRLAGITGPTELVREINNQAEGRPGLAVALARLCLSEGVQELASGDALTRDLLEALERLVGEKPSEILAAFAVGGDTGLDLAVVSNVLGISISDLYRIITQLAAGGVIFNHPAYQTISIHPHAFRHTLIRKTFFNNTSVTMPTSVYLQLAANAPSPSDVAITLLGAAARGAVIPYDYLHSMIEDADSEKVWRAYAWLGKSEAKWVLTKHPDRLQAVAAAALDNAPKLAIPMLLKTAMGDNRPLNSHPEHPLRQIKNWVEAGIPGTKEALTRRVVLFNAVQSWIAADQEIEIALKTLEFTLSPEFHAHDADPGSGLTLTIRYGYLMLPEMEQVFKLWQKAVELLENKVIIDWSPLQNLIQIWAYNYHQVEMSNDVYKKKRKFARRMLENVLHLAQDKPGIKLWARSFAKNLGWRLEIAVDSDFLTLYPQEKLENWQAENAKQAANVRSLAREWSKCPPQQIIERIVFIEREAETVKRSFPRWTPYLCAQISLLVDDHITWLHGFLSVDLPSEMITPFVSKAAAKDETGWVDIAEQCLLKPNSRSAAISLALTNEKVPQALLTHTSEYFELYHELIKVHGLRNELSTGIMNLLLSHPSDQVATSAAIGEWHSDPEGKIRSTLVSRWREVIVKRTSEDSDMSDWVLSEIFKQDASIAFDWLEARIHEENFPRARHFAGHRDAASAAIEVLDTNARKKLLQQVQPTLLASDLVDHLVGDDVEVFKALLSNLNLVDLHLAPLAGEPNAMWIEKAIVALDTGYSPDDIAGAVDGIFRGFMWSGNESEMWQGWVNSFKNLLASDDPRIQEIGQIGVQRAEIRRQKALKEELHDDIYGT